jgi:hypothetical protein
MGSWTNEDVIGFGQSEKLVSSDFEQVKSALFSEMDHTRNDLEKYIKA